MQAENIYNRLGEDLTKWQALLVQIRKARGTFDNAETRKEFGPVVIDYGKVIILTESLPFILKTIKIIYVCRKQIVLFYFSVPVLSINVSKGIISLIVFVHHYRFSPRST